MRINRRFAVYPSPDGFGVRVGRGVIPLPGAGEVVGCGVMLGDAVGLAVGEGVNTKHTPCPITPSGARLAFGVRVGRGVTPPVVGTGVGVQVITGPESSSPVALMLAAPTTITAPKNATSSAVMMAAIENWTFIRPPLANRRAEDTLEVLRAFP